MAELLRIALRAIGVVLPAAGVWGLVELRGGPPDGDFGTFLGAMLLSLFAAGVWSASDARRGPTRRVLIRWVTIAFVVGVGLGIEGTWSAPGTPPGSERISEAVWSSLYFGVPLLVAAVLGVAVAGANDQPPRGHEDTAETGTGHWGSGRKASADGRADSYR